MNLIKLTIDQNNLNDFLVQLYHLTIKDPNSFSHSQIANILRILNKASNLNNIPMNAAKSFLNTMSNILNSNEHLFQNNSKLINK